MSDYTEQARGLLKQLEGYDALWALQKPEMEANDCKAIAALIDQCVKPFKDERDRAVEERDHDTAQLQEELRVAQKDAVVSAFYLEGLERMTEERDKLQHELKLAQGWTLLGVDDQGEPHYKKDAALPEQPTRAQLIGIKAEYDAAHVGLDEAGVPRTWDFGVDGQHDHSLGLYARIDLLKSKSAPTVGEEARALARHITGACTCGRDCRMEDMRPNRHCDLNCRWCHLGDDIATAIEQAKAGKREDCIALAESMVLYTGLDVADAIRRDGA